MHCAKYFLPIRNCNSVYC